MNSPDILCTLLELVRTRAPLLLLIPSKQQSKAVAIFLAHKHKKVKHK
jgi:hypothetical protein